MMEAKHIVAVKQPYCRSSRNHALRQIVQTNQHLNKLAAIHMEFSARGMLQGACPCLPQFITHPPPLSDSNSSSSDSDSDEDKDKDSGAASAHYAPRHPDMPEPPPTSSNAALACKNPQEDGKESGPVQEHDVYAKVVLVRTPCK